MKRTFLSMAGPALLLCVCCGCASTSDPSRGGFFDGVRGLSSGEYQRRVDERQARLNELQQAGSQLREEQTNLEGRAASLDAEEQSYRQQLAQLDGDLNGLQKQLQKAKLQNKAKLAQKKKLEERLATLREEIHTKQTFTAGGPPNDQRSRLDLAKLRAEKEKLQQEILRLSSQ